MAQLSIKIGQDEYPALSIVGKIHDHEWDERESKTITLEMEHDAALELFDDDVAWSIVVESEEDPTVKTEYDNSDFCIAGDVTDHRDGTVSAKMGKPTDLEDAYELLYGGE